MTDLAYYSSFQEEADKKTSEAASQLQAEEFVPLGVYSHTFPPLPPYLKNSSVANSALKPLTLTNSPFAGAAMERILEDQKEFEKEHQFIQVCTDSYLFFLI